MDRFLPNPKLKLLDQSREVMGFRHFSLRTESAYWHWITGSILFGRNHPRLTPAKEGKSTLHPAHAALISNPKARPFDLVSKVMRFHHYARRFDCRLAAGSSNPGQPSCICYP